MHHSWGGCPGGIGPQLADLAGIALVGSPNNRKAAAMLREAQNTEWRQPAGDWRDLSRVKRQVIEPYQPRIMRTLTDRQKDFELRTQKAHGRQGKKTWKFTDF